MTSTLLMLGASLIDAGNVSHASDGRVLGEHIAAELGADPDDSQLISVRSDDEPDNSAVHNYAHGGALSGRGPTQILDGRRVSIGLREQVEAVQRRANAYQQRSDVDAVICAGGNDVLEPLEDLDPFAAVLSSTSRRDDRRLVRSSRRMISRNLQRSCDALTGLADEVMLIVGLPISATPLALDQATALDPVEPTRLLELLDAISERVHRRLSHTYRDNAQVAVMNGQPLWDTIDAPQFIDAVHPSSETSAALAASLVATAQDSMTSFGWL